MKSPVILRAWHIAAALLALLVTAPAAQSQGTLELEANIWRFNGDSDPEYLVELDDTLYFAAAGATYGAELHRHDGTAVSLAADINPGTAGSRLKWLTVYDGMIYMSAVNGSLGYELWRYDPAIGEAELVTDLHTSGSANPNWLIVYDDRLYFNADDGTQAGMWEFDAATERVTFISGVGISWPAVHDGKLFFAGGEGPSAAVRYGSELRVFDGNDVSLVADIFSGPDSASPRWLTVFDGQLFFSATDGGWGTELWTLDDMTVARVADIAEIPNPRSTRNSYPEYFTAYQNRLYFSADDGVNGRELWYYDPASGQVALAVDVTDGPGGSMAVSMTGDVGLLTEYGGALYFSAMNQNREEGRELWQFDGITASLVADVYPGPNYSSPEWLTVFDGRLFFAADNDTYGVELWSYTAASGNAPPVAVDDEATTIEGAAVDIDVLANDSDPDDDHLTIESFTQPADGQVTHEGGGALTYTPDTGFTGSDRFTYTVADASGGGATATVNVKVALLLSVLETVSVRDEPVLHSALLLAVTEAIAVSDDPALTQAVLLAVDEMVTVADNPTLGETATTIDDDSPLPAEYSLDASYPNPFNGTTIIHYVLPEAAHVRLEVFDALGRLVAVLEEGDQAAGRYAAPFDGSALTSGLYVYRIVAGPFVQTRTMAVVR